MPKCKIGDSVLMLADANEGFEAMPATVLLYVEARDLKRADALGRRHAKLQSLSQ